MNIKSLLLGSAAVLVAASTAQAADAIVVEPEPVEYVRICDAYGSGFFYIPGTETCMRISGYVRSTYDHTTKTHHVTETTTQTVAGTVINTNTNSNVFTEAGDHANWTVRGRLNIDVRNETDWGVLRSQLRLQGGDAVAGADMPVGIDRALISVAGFRLGYSDTYWTTAHAYGQGPAVNDGFFDYEQGIFFDYTYAVDGFSVTVGAQDTTGTAADMEDPDYYIGAKYAGSWGWAAVTYMYDQNGLNNATALTTGADAWKASLEFTNVGDSGWNIGGWYMTDGDDDTSYVTGAGTVNLLGTGAWTDSQWGIQANGALTDTLNGYVTYSSVDSDNTVAAVAAGYLGADQVAVGVVWAPITGLTIQAEYHQIDLDYTAASGNATDTDGFLVRITRSW